MLRVIIISPYRYKALNKFKSLVEYATKKNSIIEARTDEFDDNIYVLLDNEVSLEAIVAIPKEIVDALNDKYFDVVYIDRDYNEDEVWTVRQHLIGQQSKPIIFF